MKEKIEAPGDWLKAIHTIFAEDNGGEDKRRRILVLGESDRGKSSFCALLTRELFERGQSVGYLDADIGQKDIGPPATISLGLFGQGRGLGRADLIGMYFVGAISPFVRIGLSRLKWEGSSSMC